MLTRQSRLSIDLKLAIDRGGRAVKSQQAETLLFDMDLRCAWKFLGRFRPSNKT